MQLGIYYIFQTTTMRITSFLQPFLIHQNPYGAQDTNWFMGFTKPPSRRDQEYDHLSWDSTDFAIKNDGL